MSRFHIFDYIFLLRPLILIPCWNFLLIGAYLGRSRGGFSVYIVFGLLIYTALMGGVYILNQITDLETDRINKKLFILSEGHVPIKHAYVEMIFLWVLAIAGSLRYGIVFVIFIVVSLIIGVMYSLSPIKLKGKPILDTLSNSIGYGMINFAVGWLLVRPFEWASLLQFLPDALSICAVFMNTTIADIEGDKKSGERTTAVFLGRRVTAIISAIIMACAVLTACIMRDLVCLIPAALSLPLFIYVAINALMRKALRRNLTIASFRLPGLLFTIVTGVLYPVYFILVMVVFVSMRIYYKRRFNMIYPTLARG